ncbi:hypothetical protein [Flavobacterium succinicans]|uniref:Uncharacterized protein n=1 Tax=Flavobacterium succinicans TaxID=29536 RepID=A0A199XVI3_9FLAO|nr:hypothetical protein [Flavobacterium succinicans]OAZ05251.1 hypothetical protein FLB_03420 [Flavobacterium succinicans]
MNYIRHLTGFFEKVAIDKTLNPTHVSLYMSLFQCWNCNRFRNPISISRDELMRISKISSKATYHKCLKNLHSLGYIHYEPSYNPFKGSHVMLFNFSERLPPVPKDDSPLKNEPLFGTLPRQALNQPCTSNETGTEQALVSYINNTNLSNHSNAIKDINLNESQNFEIEETLLQNQDNERKEKKLREKKKVISEPRTTMQAPSSNGTQGFQAPKLQDIQTYFQDKQFPALEAQKFFNYFSSVGWLVGGKHPMVDWQAAAQNWMLNAPKFLYSPSVSDRAKVLHTTTEKDYTEPL